MGYPDGYYYGQGRIICDTSTFSVGDTIRVRSMTDSSKVWNQQVATVGTALVFTVPCYDYYKICTVQDIGGTPTEIGGVYKTVDYGQTIFVDNMFDKSTLRGLQGILNNHSENALNIGDIVNVKINGGNDWEMQIGAINLYNQHEVFLVSKDIWTNSVFTSAGGVAYITTSYDILHQKMQEFYGIIDADDRVYLKDTIRTCKQEGYDNWLTFTEKVFPLNRQEIDGISAGGGTPTTTISQFALFTTQANRIKKYNNVASYWWTCDGSSTGATHVWTVLSDGTITVQGSTNSYGAVPCFRLTADS